MRDETAQRRICQPLGAMHYTLTPRGNAALMALMAAALLASFLTGDGPSLGILAAFFVAGVLAGLLQGIALRRHARQFQSSSSALQVRAVLVSSIPGKASVALLWLSGVSLVLLLFIGEQYASIQTIVGAYATFSFVREAAAFPALFALRGG